ncbi:hypothetical protein V1525DRAFT_427942 [Lipomyces kononenkoae]|uniref:Uncharacterized protein n=1 Tax=Lipomyces kononenkoae TaxID=34357 RepID=A0ACC3SUL3_LIPKO
MQARKKQKHCPTPFYLDLTEMLENSDIEQIKESVNQVLQVNQNLHPAATSFIESIHHALAFADVDVVLSLQASRLSLREAKNQLGIDFELDDPDYRWSLKDEQKQSAKPLSEWPVSSTIQNIRRSKYMRAYQPESMVRTLFDILICDRLELLDNRYAAQHLKIVPEVQMEIPTNHHRKICGRADWTLGYMDEKDRLQVMLVVVEAKARGNIGASLPQLLIYLAGIQNARCTADKDSRTVFGVATDSGQFIFAILQGNRKAFASKALDWLDDKDLIVSFLDHILKDAIESSPHTIPTRTESKRIKNFEPSLGTTYTFGNQGNDDTGTDDNDFRTWNVVEINGVSLLQPCWKGD